MLFFNPWEVTFRCYQDFFRTLQRIAEEQRMEREARLQLELAKPPDATVDGGERRLVTRLGHNAAAVRPFLVHHQAMTNMSHHPVIHEVEKQAAREFVLDFHAAERALQHRLHIPLSRWQAPGAGRDRLSQVLSQSPELYQQIAGFPKAPKDLQNAMIEKLAQELQLGGQSDGATKQLQME